MMGNYASKSTKFILKLAKSVERRASLFQGKGFGTASIRQEVELTYKLLNGAPKLVIDIGGNVGNYSAEIRRRTPAAEIHIFEPSSSNVQILRERFGGDANINIVPAAVSNSNGDATLFSDRPGSGLASLTKRNLDHFNINFESNESVKTLKFEEYWESQLGRRRCDIVKIDIEGHELLALEGFGQSIRFINVIQFEFGGCNIDTRTYFQDFWYYFQEHNFAIFRITPIGLDLINSYSEHDEIFSTTNFIAMSKS